MHSGPGVRATPEGARTGVIYRLAPHLRLVKEHAQRAFLLGEHQRIRITDAAEIDLFEWLSAGLSLHELHERAGARLAQCLYALDGHVAAGYVMRCQSVEASSDPGAAWLGGPGHCAPVPSARTIALEFLDPDDALRQVIVKAFRACDLTVDDRSPVRVLVVDDYRDPRIGHRFERWAGQSDSRCVLFRPRGRTVWLGPVVGMANACWDCLRHRLLDNSPIETSLWRATGRHAVFQSTAPSTPETWMVAAMFAATQLLRAPLWQADDRQAAMPLMNLDLASFQLTRHDAPRRPQCAACGDPMLMGQKGWRPLALQAREKTFVSDGGHRVMPPDATYERLKHLVSPVTGVVSNLGPIPLRSDALRNVYGATHFITPAWADPLEADRFEMVSVGKGVTPAQARTSALCEAIERKCARYQGDEPVLMARLADLGESAFAPQALLLFSDRQYAQRASAKETHRIASPRAQQVPGPFDGSETTAWTPVWSLSRERTAWVPLAYGFAGTPTQGGERSCNWDSNGCATGNCLEEAVLQGLLELIERDAAAIYWYNRIQRPGVTPETFDDPYFEQVRAHYAATGHELWVLDITHDLGAWTFFAIAKDREGSRYAAGLGCHLDPRLAVQRALSELHQVFDPTRSGAPLWDGRDVVDAAYLLPDPSLTRRACDYANHASHDLAQDVAWLVRQMGRRGLETLVLDYSRPDIPLHAIKAIVPGLRHFWPRYAPGRLYDVPVELGWRVSALGEAELNPLALQM